MTSFHFGSVRRLARAAFGAALLTTAMHAPSALAQSLKVTVTTIADTTDPMPNTSGTFGAFNLPTIDNGNLAFSGFNGTRSGFYASINGTLSVVADSLGSSDLENQASISGNEVAFLSGSSLYGWTPSSPATPVVVSFSTPSPFGFGTITQLISFITPAIHNGTFAFTATAQYFDPSNPACTGPPTSNNSSPLQSAAFTSTNGVISAKTLMGYSPAGAGSTQTSWSFNVTSFDGTNMVGFGHGSSGGAVGIYEATGNTVTQIAARGASIPGVGVLNSFENPSISDGNIAFAAVTSGSAEDDVVFADLGDVLQVIASLSTPVPGGTGDFTGFGNASIDGNRVAFEGFWGTGISPHSGLFLWDNGSLNRIIGDGDQIGALTIASLDPSDLVGNQFLNGNQIVFVANVGPFGDTEGVYVATVTAPEPSSLALAMIGAAMAFAYFAKVRRRPRLSVARFTLRKVSETRRILASNQLLGQESLFRAHRIYG